MIVGIGVDVVDLARFERALARTPELAARVLTPAERALAVESQAARFAAKEALAKALGAPAGMAWHDCEVVLEASGAPRFTLRGTVQEALERAGGSRTHLSLSHDAGIATAYVVVESA
ncbi:holo-ACP synthase [Nocardioidaceae bacterium]|nr:holo-ACP synthase [Nocardioidaceae bacterium]